MSRKPQAETSHRLYPDLDDPEELGDTHPWRLLEFDRKGRSPNVDPFKVDLPDRGRQISRESILRDYASSRMMRRGSWVDIYTVWIDLSELPEANVEDADEYDWQDMSTGRGVFPAPKIFIPAKVFSDGGWTADLSNARILDGNHRIMYWRELGYDAAIVWIIQEIPARRGSKSTIDPGLEVFSQDGPSYSVKGVIHPTFASGMIDSLNGLLQEDLYEAMGMAPPKNSREAAIKDREIADKIARLSRAISAPEGPALVIEIMIVEEAERGRGVGREAVRRIEQNLRRSGVRSVILQSANIDGRHSEGFWRKMGYKEWPIRFKSRDKIHFKVLS